MAGTGWALDDIPWGRFDPARVDPHIVELVKAASMVESNGRDYATYLCNVFAGDRPFQVAAKVWADEEVRHGLALARWAQMADSSFDFEDAFSRFTEGYKLPVASRTSVRGTRTGELVSRCMVEVGTSSYYTALGQATDEPVLKEICRRIAVDELRHYKLFYSHLKRYLEAEHVGKLRRGLIALGRVRETGDDELAYAYYAANAVGETYDRRRWSKAYLDRAYSLYRQEHLDRVVAMSLKAAGFKPNGRFAQWLSRLAYGLIRRRCERALSAAT